MKTETAVRQQKSGRSSKRKGRASNSRQLVVKALKLRATGLTQEEVAAELGIARSTVATLFPKQIRDPEDAIKGKLFVEWIDEHSEEDPYLGQLVKGHSLTSSQQRAYHRFRFEGVNPRLGTVETMLCSWAVLFEDFEEWVLEEAERREEALCLWARGQAPAWYADNSDSRILEDLGSCDPKWVAEARHQGAVLGVLTSNGHRRRQERQLVAA